MNEHNNTSIEKTIDWTFFDKYRDCDINQTALAKDTNAMANRQLQLQQISGYQTALNKIPTWAATEKIIYPPHISLEQCSSETTARYKANIAQRLLQTIKPSLRKPTTYTFADLTGGMGVDFSFIAKHLQTIRNENGNNKYLYVEQQEHLCNIAQHNFKVLGIEQVDINNTNAEEIIKGNDFFDIVMLDPARRNKHGARTYDIADCTPNYIQLQDKLLSHALFVIVKLSPMLDHIEVLRQVKCVKEIHFVGTKRECKELLVIASQHIDKPLGIFAAAEIDTIHIEQHQINQPVKIAETINEGMMLVEPTSTMMKTQAYGFICQNYNLKAIAKNSHLFIGNINQRHLLPDNLFRIFTIENISSMNKTQLRQTLTGIDRANITTRNFPLSAPQLQQKLKLKDGGTKYIFATTDSQQQHIIIVANKLSE